MMVVSDSTVTTQELYQKKKIKSIERSIKLGLGFDIVLKWTTLQSFLWIVVLEKDPNWLGNFLKLTQR